MDGLIHISELSWSHVNHPSEVLEIGQTVEVKVLDIDRERQRISLGLKQTQADPWQRVLESYGQDDVVWGRVTKVVQSPHIAFIVVKDVVWSSPFDSVQFPPSKKPLSHLTTKRHSTALKFVAHPLYRPKFVAMN
jgi:hypothetical protein